MRWLALVLMIGCGRIGFDVQGMGDDTNPIVDAARDTPPPNAVTKTWGENSNDDFRGVTRDTYLTNASVAEESFNFGGADNIRVRNDRVALLFFDLSAIPAGAQIVSAKIRFVTEETNPATFVVRRVLEAWDEGSSDGVAGASNWTMRNAAPWSGAGASPPSVDATGLTLMNPAGLGEVTYDLPVSMIATLFAQPNFGIAMSTTDTGGFQVMSSENSATSRPRLTITYVPN